MQVRVTKFRDNAVVPSYTTPGAAAFDFTAAEQTVIPAHGQGLVPTGLGFGIPVDHVLHVFARSSTFSKLGLFLSNSVGVIDSDYSGPTDELFIMMYNPGETPVTIEAGVRVAQGIIYPVPRIDFIEGQPGDISRGGIGSTGGYVDKSPNP